MIVLKPITHDLTPDAMLYGRVTTVAWQPATTLGEGYARHMLTRAFDHYVNHDALAWEPGWWYRLLWRWLDYPTSRWLAVIAAATLVAGCSGEKPAQQTQPSTNAAIAVDMLFEHDGCRVYRFEDAGYNRYFARCGGQSASLDYGHTVHAGKTTHWVPETLVVTEDRP